jgi:hypothetical protein
LTSIDLAYNNIGDKGVKAIGEGLKVNTSLTFIYLCYNNIGDKGAKAIGEALKVNTSLTSIDLCYSYIGDEGGKAIGEGLKVNTSLTSIDLQENNIGDEGARKIIKALETNTLNSPDVLLAHNQISADVYEQLDAIERRRSESNGVRYGEAEHPGPVAKRKKIEHVDDAPKLKVTKKELHTKIKKLEMQVEELRTMMVTIVANKINSHDEVLDVTTEMRIKERLKETVDLT